MKRSNIKIYRAILLISISSSLFLSFLRLNGGIQDGFSAFLPKTAQGYLHWPGNSSEWTEINPADQGLDAAKISQMFDLIESSSYDVHSVIIVKNGLRSRRCLI